VGVFQRLRCRRCEDVELRKEHRMKLLVRCLLAAGLIVAIAGGAAAQDPVTTIVRDPAQPQMVLTQEEMATAVAMPFPELMATEGDTDVAQNSPGLPAVVNGWAPGSAPYVEKWTVLSPSEAQAMGQMPQTYGTAPTNPCLAPTVLQRWTMEGQYPVGFRGSTASSSSLRRRHVRVLRRSSPAARSHAA
jgi:hypothetical protein